MSETVQGSPRFDQLKILKMGNTQIINSAVAGSLTSSTVYHNLGFNPIVTGFLTVTSSGTISRPIPFHIFNSSTGVLRYGIEIEVYPTYVNFVFQNISLGVSLTCNIRYYILGEISQ